MFYLETSLHCSIKLPQEGTNELSKDGSNWGIFLLFNNFLQNCSVTFLCFQQCVFEDDFDQLSRDGFDLMTRQVMFNVRNVSLVPFLENSLYYLVVLKSYPKISMVLSHFQGQKVTI